MYRQWGHTCNQSSPKSKMPLIGPQAVNASFHFFLRHPTWRTRLLFSSISLSSIAQPGRGESGVMNNGLPGIGLATDCNVHVAHGDSFLAHTEDPMPLLTTPQQHVARSNDPAMRHPAPQLIGIQTQPLAEFSSSSKDQDRLGHRAKEKQLDRVCDGIQCRRSGSHWILMLTSCGRNSF